MAISTAVDLSAVARVVGIKTSYVDLRAGGSTILPQRIAVVGQGSTASTYSTVKAQVTSAQQAAAAYGFGSPLHMACLQLFPQNGQGVGLIPVTLYPLVDAGSAVAAAGDITPSGTQTAAASYIVYINGIASQAFVFAAAASIADRTLAITNAINGQLALPVTATDNTTDVTITSKWKGLTGNDLEIEVVGGATAGTVFAITQPVGGLLDPDVTPALDQIGDVWETLILNCSNTGDTAALTAFNTFGEGRWGALTRKPCVVFTGSNEVSVTAAIAVPEARKTEKVNSQLISPGSKSLPLVIAAAQLAPIAVIANNNPAHDYGSQAVSLIAPGTDLQQWDYAQRDQAVKGGSSTTIVKDGVVNISDVVTFYHPSGDNLPAYRFVVDIIKLQNAIFSIDLVFASPDWDGAPLIPDDQATSNRSARKPKAAIAAIAAVVDGLALEAILSDPAGIKKTIIAGINESNPKRLDAAVTLKLSGNAGIISIDQNFGFYFGAATIVA
jgi:phage tail sheath gpL-like